MGNNRKRSATYHSARDGLGGGNSRRSKRRRKEAGLAQPGFFVPSFGVRRPVLETPEAIEFYEGLKRILPKNYRAKPVGRMALTLLEQRMIIKGFHELDVEPEKTEVKNVAEALRPDLKQSLKGVPRRLELGLGRVDAFGDKNRPTRVGIIPSGWKGFGKTYQEKGIDNVVLPLPVLVREAHLAVGAVTNGFSGHEGFEDTPMTQNAMNRTPHITIAEKQRGGPISQSEMSGLAGSIQEIMPSSLTLFDPIIYLRLGRSPDEAVSLFARGPRYARNQSELGL